MDRCAVIATHHKSGTVWMNHTFRKIGAALDIPVVNAGRDAGRTALVPPVILCAAGAVPASYPSLLSRDDVRVFHLIRDPRDICISGMHYHRTSGEKWLQRPRQELGGLTYQQALNALGCDRDRLLLEMDHTLPNILAAMLAWDYAMPRSFECKYEDLIADSECRIFAKIAAHLGFAGREAAVCRNVFWRFATFGGAARKKGRVAHIRSGEPRQWTTVFDRALGEAFVARFGDALIRLGYEPDHSWIDRLPKTQSPETGAA